ncbi:tRNA modification GTPase GTPBP3, mitochondrial [Eufriesea mexicana]|uniref:tRNA modification GTPase GTPBP3, mitochondrial n=2 Tax=Eufriesea mexicana TaxID=516756 RepID=A0A310SHR4_9HYME|nr:PREDICTED: tRNA modification GTPase GTPBP3, mitochondrial isoform X1 [Eufriesea mexicana]OAD58147.1 tRNA modification GTPase GTPBP3, mitochondrial [Eufriesea mexicana]
MTKISVLKPRIALLRKIHDPETKEILDVGLCLWFPEPNSFTGENSVEFHVHGGPAVVMSVLNALSKLRFQVASPGEFTKRALLNGKLDLTEAEGIRDLIEAETEKQRKQATNQVNGSLRCLYDSWRITLLNILAGLEAYIDFSEEHNITSNVLEDTKSGVKKLSIEIQQHLADGRKGEILRTGIHVTIFGESNVGKSSLLNLLSRKDAAIVTSSPGTTRDVIQLTTNICGYPMILADTAGIRNDPENEIEIAGIRKAKEHSHRADFIICVISAEINIATPLHEFLQQYKNFLGIDKKRVLTVLNKVDLLNKEDKEKWRHENVVLVSCKTQEGLKELINALGQCFEEICGDPCEENPVISHARYRNHLLLVSDYLKLYLEKIEVPNYDIAISLQDIRSAVRELGKITGSISNEEILDVIFKDFCIGK